MNDGLNNTEQMYSPCIVCYRVNGVTILRSEETGELRGIEEPLETVCPYSVEEYALTKSLDAVLNKRDAYLQAKSICNFCCVPHGLESEGSAYPARSAA